MTVPLNELNEAFRVCPFLAASVNALLSTVILLVRLSIPLAALASTLRLILVLIPDRLLLICATTGLRLAGPCKLICAVKLKADAIVYFLPYK